MNNIITKEIIETLTSKDGQLLFIPTLRFLSEFNVDEKALVLKNLIQQTKWQDQSLVLTDVDSFIESFLSSIDSSEHIENYCCTSRAHH